jgi:hypothetical protein
LFCVVSYGSVACLFAQGTYEYGRQLLSAALALRQSCKLPTDGNSELSQNLWHSWKSLQMVGQEQMTRLRVSAVFHRSVEEVLEPHCSTEVLSLRPADVVCAVRVHLV